MSGTGTGLFGKMSGMLQHYRTSTAILRKVLKSPMSFDRSMEIIREGVEKREKNFLSMLEKCVFRNPRSPYKALLDHAGYSFGDIESMVGEKGLEETLKKLHSDGVYLTIQEYKGRIPAVRGNRTFRFKETDFNNASLSSGLDTQTGGTTGRSTKVKVPLEYILQNTVYGIHASRLYDIPGRKAIVWLPILPALEGFFFNLRFGVAGNTPVKWYSQVDGRNMKPSMEDRLKTATTIRMSRLYGIRLPKPEFVDIGSTHTIAQWMDGNLKGGPGYAVVTYASSAFRLVMEAKKRGLNLGKTVFWLMGEPLTEKKRDLIESYGCRAYTLYGCNELMLIGHACLNSGEVDDIHVCRDKLAVIQHARDVEHSNVKVDAFLFTTLMEISSKIFINTEIGDYGVLHRKPCGCPFEELGYVEHIHTIRSFEKLTAEGMTFTGSNLVYLVEELLPKKFGGDLTNYQFLEAEDASGFTRLYILVSPEIADFDEKALRETIFEGLFHGHDPEYVGARVMKDVWTRTNTIQVRRVNPIATRRGKVMPLFICKEKEIAGTGLLS
ncbi:MAG: hypothetical protein HY896_05360 [Deltaproteobacteria bacterium]|nr:hypothetical protein [Deltaproteobacteria bacterium]